VRSLVVIHPAAPPCGNDGAYFSLLPERAG
jgi:hypothetical protein